MLVPVLNLSRLLLHGMQCCHVIGRLDICSNKQLRSAINGISSKYMEFILQQVTDSAI